MNNQTKQQLTSSLAGTSETPPATGVAWVSDRSGEVTQSLRTTLADWLSGSLGVLGVGGEVRVAIVNDAEMAAAHHRYAGVTGTTDVLTFDLRRPDMDRPPEQGDGPQASPDRLDVDILICIDEARRQSERRGHAVEHELLLYALHGVMHCLGHDDHDDAAYDRMHAEEDRVLEALGIGAVFSREERGP